MLKKNKGNKITQKPKALPKWSKKSLLTRLHGTAPLMHVRQKALDKAARNHTIRETIVFMAAERALNSMVYEIGFTNRQTKNKTRQIIERLLRDKKIAFDGETKVDFSKAETSLKRLLGKNNAEQFKQYFENYLQDEINLQKAI